MAAVRERLRLAVVAWLMLQVMALSAFVPRDCCAAHTPAVVDPEHRCHESADATYCPMRGPDGTPCPMHRGHMAGTAHHHGPADRERPDDDCAMRGTCNGPLDALLTLIWQHGVLDEPAATAPDILSSYLPAHSRERAAGLLSATDSPPPRA